MDGDKISWVPKTRSTVAGDLKSNYGWTFTAQNDVMNADRQSWLDGSTVRAALIESGGHRVIRVIESNPLNDEMFSVMTSHRHRMEVLDGTFYYFGLRIPRGHPLTDYPDGGYYCPETSKSNKENWEDCRPPPRTSRHKLAVAESDQQNPNDEEDQSRCDKPKVGRLLARIEISA